MIYIFVGFRWRGRTRAYGIGLRLPWMAPCYTHERGRLRLQHRGAL